MLTRALIVLLLALNLGVALWWATRARPQDAEAAPPPSGVARLQLVAETAAAPAASPLGGVVAQRPAASPPATPSQCVSFGPYLDAAAAALAQQRLQPLALRVIRREAFAGPARGWNVFLPPYPSTAEVEAVAQRVAAAGFADHFVVREGRQANSLALGRYASEASARRRAATLVAAGFPAQAEPIGSAPARYWLDVVAASDFDPARAQALAAATGHRALDCASVN